MKRLIEFLIEGCFHKWEVENDIKIWEGHDTTKLPTEARYVLQCKKCGKIKTVKIF
jgi:translation initiation factor 2 beta subunit (eIF-2beta)/eIF-5